MSDSHSSYDPEGMAQLQSRLFPFAYHLLGEAEEAKDVASEALTAFLEKERAGETAHVENREAYIFAMVRNRALNRLNQKKRTEYLGPWLPEPIFLEEERTDTTVDCGYAMAILLGKLSPNERAVFLMKECFGFEHREIAVQFDLTEEQSRKILQRSREKIGGEGALKNRSGLAEKGKLLQAFLRAVQDGNLESLQSLLKEDIVVYSDGGGKAKAALQPILGRLNSFKFITGLLRKSSTEDVPQEFRPMVFGGDVYVLVTRGSEIDSFVSLELENGLISGLYIQRNPDKLKNMEKFVTF